MSNVRFFALALLLLSGCDQDPLGCSIGTLPGGYGLQQWDSGDLYYLKGPGETETGGVLEGTVSQIGWNDQFIVAERHSTFRGDADGWMLVNVRSHQISGPYRESAWRKNPVLSNVRVYKASSAWQTLPKCRTESRQLIGWQRLGESARSNST